MTTEDSWRLIQQLQTVANHYRYVCSCLFSQMISKCQPSNWRQDHGLPLWLRPWKVYVLNYFFKQWRLVDHGFLSAQCFPCWKTFGGKTLFSSVTKQEISAIFFLLLYLGLYFLLILAQSLQSLYMC